MHHHELTYSIAIPADRRLIGRHSDLYRHTHLAIVHALAEFGVRAEPFRLTGVRSADPDRYLCFQRRAAEDLIASGYKVLGSAQRKSRRAVLQHGSLLLRASRWATELPGLLELTATSIPVRPFADGLSAALSSVLSIDWQPRELSSQEKQRAVEIIEQRFGSPQWLARR